MTRFPGAVVRYRGRIAVAWLGACAALLPLANRAEEALDVSARIEGSESAAVESLLATRFESPFARNALLVITGLPAPSTDAGKDALREVVAAVGSEPHVTRTFSYLDTADPLFLGSTGSFVIVGFDPRASSVDAVIPSLRAATAPVAARLARSHPEAALKWTGEPILNYDIRRASSADVRSAERRALPLTLALLLLAFGAFTAALLPIASGALAIILALAAAALLARVMPLAVTLQSIVSMLGLGLGIDYALLTVSRFRESLRRGRNAEEAAEDAVRHAGGTVALSGAAVGIGFLGLLVIPLSEIRSIAVGGLLVVAASVLLATTLLPGLLAWLGARVGMGWRESRLLVRITADPWRRWGAFVAAHPVVVLAVAGVPTVLLALEARRLHTGFPLDGLPPALESTLALRELQSMERSGLIQEIRVVLEFPEETSAVSAEGWAATRRLGERISADPRVARVRSLRTYAGDRADDLGFISLLPGFLKRCYLSGEGDAALLEVIPRESAQPTELSGFVHELRGPEAASWAELPGVRLHVGGVPAFNADYEDALNGRSAAAIALVIAGTFVTLLFGFRSLLIPIKAVALNLLSVAAAFGAVVLVFQDGHGAGGLGLAGPTACIFPAVPIVVFCIVFGLSMDYEVFLVARLVEARRAGWSDAAGLAEALARTGGVITSAAAIMVAVFGAFALGDFLLIKMLGFALAVAVLIDATVIRVALGPALLCLAGGWNWWPGTVAGHRNESGGPIEAGGNAPLTPPLRRSNAVADPAEARS